MEDYLKITKIIKKGNRIDYDYEIQGKWKIFLHENEKMFIEYDNNIENVPNSIAIIPFLCNILPISWFFNLEIYVDTLDKAFYDCLLNVKEGYIKMYPQINFKGSLTVNKTEENNYTPSGVATLFSGGVDALDTLIQHMDEKPTLLTVWGADIKLNDEKGWEKVNNHSNFVANQYGLEYSYARTNFRTFLNANNLTIEIQREIDGGWWHEFQHGIGILGLFSPLAYINKYGIIYIASSFAKEDLGKYTCASDPSIDNNLRFSSCKVIHDGCEFTRQDKIENICNFFSKENQPPIPIRVCWQSEGGDNCCECEKCYRTILGIIAEKKDPKDFGFNLTNEKRNKMIKRLPKLDGVKYNFSFYYSQIKDRFIKNYRLEETPADLIWFRNFKFKNYHSKHRLRIKKLKRFVKSKIRRMS